MYTFQYQTPSGKWEYYKIPYNDNSGETWFTHVFWGDRLYALQQAKAFSLRQKMMTRIITEGETVHGFIDEKGMVTGNPNVFKGK